MSSTEKCAECGTEFEKRVHNQRFCDKECCRVNTNRRILAQYHEKKNRSTEGRVCAEKGCTTLLSRYNDDIYCGSHQLRQHLDKLDRWGWEVDEKKLGFV